MNDTNQIKVFYTRIIIIIYRPNDPVNREVQGPFRRGGARAAHLAGAYPAYLSLVSRVQDFVGRTVRLHHGV